MVAFTDHGKSTLSLHWAQAVVILLSVTAGGAGGVHLTANTGLCVEQRVSEPA